MSEIVQTEAKLNKLLEGTTAAILSEVVCEMAENKELKVKFNRYLDTPYLDGVGAKELCKPILAEKEKLHFKKELALFLDNHFEKKERKQVILFFFGVEAKVGKAWHWQTYARRQDGKEVLLKWLLESLEQSNTEKREKREQKKQRSKKS